MILIHQLLEQPSLLAYFIGADNYAWLQFRSGERRLLAKPLLYFEKRLPTFIRIHKTALINPTCIASVHQPPRPKMAGSVRLVDGTELPVSRRRWKEMAQLLKSESNKVEVINLSGSDGSNTIQEYAKPLQIQVIMKGEMLLLAEQCLRQLDVCYTLQSSLVGAELASALLLSPPSNWPKLIIIDSRINRADSIMTIQMLKGHARLRAIPVIYLIPSSENIMPAYQLDANSVIIIPADLNALVRTLNQIVDYWLKTVQLVD